MRMSLAVRVLGPVRIERDGTAMTLGRQARAVLALLALQPGTPVSTEVLIEALWAERPPRTARVHVQGLVSTLRRQLGHCSRAHRRIVTEPMGYLLALSRSELDLHRFREAAALGDRLRCEGRRRPAVQRYAEALAAWSGTPCVDLDLPAIRQLTEPLVQSHADILEQWAALALELGDGATSIAAVLRPAVEQHPYRERTRELLMTALCRAGRCPEALMVYEQGRRILAEELGVDPSSPLRQLHRDLLRQLA